MDHNDIAALSKGFAPIVEQYAADAVKAVTEPLLARLAEIEARPPLKGDQGERGETGANGKVDPVEMATLVIGEVEKVAAPLVEKIAEIEARPLLKGDPGEPGKDAEPALPGDKGDKGDTGERGPEGPPPSKEAVVEALTEIGVTEILHEVATAWLIENPPKGGAPGEVGPEGPVGPSGPRGDPGNAADPEETARLVVAEVQRVAADYLSCAPDEIAVDVAKAISLISESPQVMHKTPPIILNFASQDKRKTITTRKDKDGNLVADVVEHN